MDPDPKHCSGPSLSCCGESWAWCAKSSPGWIVRLFTYVFVGQDPRDEPEEAGHAAPHLCRQGGLRQGQARRQDLHPRPQGVHTRQGNLTILATFIVKPKYVLSV